MFKIKINVMGKYINVDSNGNFLGHTGKVKSLINDGAIVQDTPHYVPGKSVCVVENGLFDAAAYAYDEEEFNVFFRDQSGRRKTFLEYDYAEQLSQ